MQNCITTRRRRAIMCQDTGRGTSRTDSAGAVGRRTARTLDLREEEAMAASEQSGYLPGDPRYGLSGEALKRYYRGKPAQWVVFAWDKVGQAAVRSAQVARMRSSLCQAAT